jgi:hypothetical protein
VALCIQKVYPLGCLGARVKNVGKLFRFCITLRHDIDRERGNSDSFAGRDSKGMA